MKNDITSEPDISPAPRTSCTVGKPDGNDMSATAVSDVLQFPLSFATPIRPNTNLLLNIVLTYVEPSKVNPDLAVIPRLTGSKLSFEPVTALSARDYAPIQMTLVCWPDDVALKCTSFMVIDDEDAVPTCATS